MTMKFTTKQDREQDQPDHDVAAHQEPAERGDDMPGRGGALVAMREDQPRGRDVQRKAQQRRQQQERRERREVERPLQEQRHHQHEHGGGDGQRQPEIEDQRRQRQDEHGQQRDDAEREADVAARREAAEPRRDRRQEGRKAGCRYQTGIPAAGGVTFNPWAA
jgi:hypothetical protein